MPLFNSTATKIYWVKKISGRGVAFAPPHFPPQVTPILTDEYSVFFIANATKINLNGHFVLSTLLQHVPRQFGG